MVRALIFFIGLTAGAFGALVGLGGGVLMIPLMVGILRMSQHKAHGTSLATLVFTGIAGMVIYQSFGTVDHIAALALAASAIIMTHIGAKYALAMPEWQLKRAFGGLLCFVSVVLLLKAFYLPVLFAPEVLAKILILLVVGAVTGFLSGMMGVGGGSIMVPAMVILTGADQVTAQGTSLLAMIPIGIAGAYSHWNLGTVNKEMLPLLIPGIIIGALAGSYMAHILPELTLRLLFAAILLWTGVKYLNTAKPH